MDHAVKAVEGADPGATDQRLAPVVPDAAKARAEQDVGKVAGKVVEQGAALAVKGVGRAAARSRTRPADRCKLEIHERR